MQYQTNVISILHQCIWHWRKWQQKGQDNNRTWFWTYTRCRVISHHYSGVLTVSCSHPSLPVWLQDHCCSFLIISGSCATVFWFFLPFPTQYLSETLLIKYLTSWKSLSCVFHWIFPMFSNFPFQLTKLLCWSILVHQESFYFSLFNSFFSGLKVTLFSSLSFPGNTNSWLN